MKKLLLLALALPSLAFAQPAADMRPHCATRRSPATPSPGTRRGLTTEVGRPMAGTEAEARGREWAVRRLTDWASATSGSSRSTCRSGCAARSGPRSSRPSRNRSSSPRSAIAARRQARGIEAEVVRFDSVEALQAAPTRRCVGESSSSPTTCRRTGRLGYGPFGAPRRRGPTIASRKGAAAIVVRSIGTDHHRNPHTGVQFRRRRRADPGRRALHPRRRAAAAHPRPRRTSRCGCS